MRLARGLVALLAVALATTAVPGSAAEEPFAGARALAVIGGETITVAEFEREMRRRGVFPDDFAAYRRDLLEEMVRQKALENVARRDGYAEHPDVQRVLRRAMVSKYVDDHLDSLLEQAQAALTDEDVERHYREQADEYRVAERVRGAIILIEIPPDATPETLVELEQKAAAIREEAASADERAFGALARRHSADRATRYLGGKIGGWISADGRPLKWGDEVVEALFALSDPGEVGPLVRGADGFYVVRLLEREESKLLPLEYLRAGIKQRILKARRAQLREEFYAGLFGELDVQRDLELLESVEVPPGGPGTPPAAGTAGRGGSRGRGH